MTLLNHFYWFSGSTLGGIFGSIIKFNTRGLEFILTSLFVVIFMEQWSKESEHANAIIGFIAGLICLLCFGSENFILPSMAVIVAGLTMIRRWTDD